MRDFYPHSRLIYNTSDYPFPTLIGGITITENPETGAHIFWAFPIGTKPRLMSDFNCRSPRYFTSFVSAAQYIHLADDFVAAINEAII